MKIEIIKEIKELIEDNALALASVDKSGNPHCIAIGFVKVVSENQILATDNYMFKTRENISNNPRVVLVVWNRGWKENCIGYRLEGIAKYFKYGKWYDFVKKIPENEGEPCKGAILITIDKIKRLA